VWLSVIISNGRSTDVVWHDRCLNVAVRRASDTSAPAAAARRGIDSRYLSCANVDQVDRIVAGVRDVQPIRGQINIGAIESSLGSIRWQGHMTEQTKRRLDRFCIDEPCATPRLAELTIRQATAHHLAAVSI
jgi:hypothetical protein